MHTANKSLSPLAKIAFWFISINALAGAISLILFPARTETLFFWEIKPPLTAALFGALYLGGAVVVGLVTYRGQWEPARYLAPILVSAGILISITTFLHLDRFTPGFKLFYWLVVYIGAPLLAILFYIQHERGGANWAVVEPVKPLTRRVAVVTGGVLLLAGLVVLIWPGLIVPIWPWTIAPLMVRIFTSWFSAFGVGLLWFLYERDWGRLYQVANLMIAAAVFDLLMVFIHRGDLNSSGLNLWIFCAHLTAFALVGIFLHWWQRRPTAG